jgi:hypothetical protein
MAGARPTFRGARQIAFQRLTYASNARGCAEHRAESDVRPDAWTRTRVGLAQR